MQPLVGVMQSYGFGHLIQIRISFGSRDPVFLQYLNRLNFCKFYPFFTHFHQLLSSFPLFSLRFPLFSSLFPSFYHFSLYLLILNMSLIIQSQYFRCLLPVMCAMMSKIKQNLSLSLYSHGTLALRW